MEEKFILATIDIHVERLQPGAGYRIYVDDDLFNERNWRWKGKTYLTELLQISARPGKYTVKVEKIGSGKTKFVARNLKIKLGDANVIDENTVEVI